MAQGIAAPMRSVTVPLGPRSYEIMIGPGIATQAGMAIQALAPGAKCAVVTDSHVAPIHLPALRESLARAGIEAGEIVLPEGETSKSFTQLERLCGALLDL